jgi:hypothetical protein
MKLLRVLILTGFVALLLVSSTRVASASSAVAFDGAHLAQTSRAGIPTTDPEANRNKDLNFKDKVLSGPVGDAIADTADRATSVIQSLSFLSLFAELTNKAAEISPFDNDFTSTTQGSIGAAIRDSNAFILNIINLAYILILLLIALATIFDIQAYSASKLLPRLVLAILLSNFGLFAVVAISDFSQALGGGLVDGMMQDVNRLVVDISRNSLSHISLQVGLSAVSLLTGGATVPIQFMYEALYPPNWFTVAFALTALILFLRIVGLWVLAIFAPFGIAFGVLPATQGFAKKYWNKVISYAFVGPIMIFFIRLGMIVYQASGSIADGFGSGKIPLFPFTVGEMVRFIVTAVVLYIGLVFVKKMGVEVANFVIGGAQKLFGAALGASLAAGKFGMGFLKSAGIAGLGPRAGQIWEGLGTRLGERYATQPQSRKSIYGSWFAGLGQELVKAGGGKETGVLGRVGSVFNRAGADLRKGQEGVINPFTAYTPFGMGAFVRGVESKMAGTDDKSQSFQKRAQIIDGRNVDDINDLLKSNELSNDDRQGLMYYAATKGLFGSSQEHVDKDGNLIQALPEKMIGWKNLEPQMDSRYKNLIQSEAARRNFALAPDVLSKLPGSADWKKAVATFAKKQDLTEQSTEALSNPTFANAIIDAGYADRPSISAPWKASQAQALGKGAAAASRVLANNDVEMRTEKGQNRYVKLANAAIKLGVAPEDVIPDALVTQLSRISAQLGSVAAGLKTAALYKPETYKYQAPSAVTRAFQQMTNAEKAIKAYTALPRALQTAVKNAVRNDDKRAGNKQAREFVSEDVVAVLRADIPAALGQSKP